MSVRRLLWMLLGTLLGCWLSTLVYAACPVRDNTYVEGTEIEPNSVMANEDALFEGIQNGLSTDCIADNAITTAKIATGGVTSSDILDGTITTADLAFSIAGGALLPSGAVYFMISGSCPSGTTDVSATYSNLFVRINATAGSTGGGDTHSHTAGTYAGSAHTHSVPRDGWGATDVGTAGRLATAENAGAGNALATATADNATGSGGGGAISGSSSSGDNVPSYVTMKACQVN